MVMAGKLSWRFRDIRVCRPEEAESARDGSWLAAPPGFTATAMPFREKEETAFSPEFPIIYLS